MENLLTLDLDFFKLNFLYEYVDKMYDIKFKEYIFNEDNNSHLYTESWNQKQKKIEKQKNDLKKLKKDKDEKKTSIIKKMIDRILNFIRNIKEKIMNAFNVSKEKVIISTLTKLDGNAKIDIDVDRYEDELEILLNEQKEVYKTLDKIKKGNLNHSDVEKLKKTREINSNKIKKIRNKVDRVYSTASDIVHIGKTVVKTAVGVAVAYKAIKFWKDVKSQLNNINEQENYFKNFQNNYDNSTNNVSNDDCRSVFNEAQQSHAAYSKTIFEVVADYEKMADTYKDETQTSLDNETLQDAKKVKKSYRSYLQELSNKMVHTNVDELKIQENEYNRIIEQLKAENKSFKQCSKHSLYDIQQLKLRVESLYRQIFKGTDNSSYAELHKNEEKIKDTDQLYDTLEKKDVKIVFTKF